MLTAAMHTEPRSEAQSLAIGVPAQRSSLQAKAGVSTIACERFVNTAKGLVTGTTSTHDAYGIVSGTPASGLRW